LWRHTAFSFQSQTTRRNLQQIARLLQLTYVYSFMPSAVPSICCKQFYSFSNNNKQILSINSTFYITVNLISCCLGIMISLPARYQRHRPVLMQKPVPQTAAVLQLNLFDLHSCWYCSLALSGFYSTTLALSGFYKCTKKLTQSDYYHDRKKEEITSFLDQVYRCLARR